MRFIALLCTAALLSWVLYHYDISQVSELVFELNVADHLAIFLFLTGNLFFSCVRFYGLLRSFGLNITFWSSLRANVLAQVASVFLLPIVGHILGRAIFMKRHSIPASALASITMYEKIVTLVSSSALCVIGLWYLYGEQARTWIESAVGNIHIGHIAVIGGIAVLLSMRVGALRLERRLSRQIFSAKSVQTTAYTLVITLVAHGCMIGAYSRVATAVGLSFDDPNNFAASAIIMFLAGLPLSVSGWGIRELASVQFLGTLGVSPDNAVAVSILLGVAALACIIIGGLVVSLLPDRSKPRIQHASDVARSLQLDKAIVAILGVLTSVALFFQFHVPVGGTVIAINAADPLALAGGALFMVYFFHNKRCPAWRLSGVLMMLGILSGVIVLAFVIGYFSFGVTNWALSNRLIGWLVLLAYFCAGASVAALWGNNGTRRVLESLAIAGCLVSLYLYVYAYLGNLGLAELRDRFMPPFSEMSPNRNALAFQLLVAMGGALSLASIPQRDSTTRWSVITACLALGVFMTGSRAGMGTEALILLAVAASRLMPIRKIAIIALSVPAFVYGPILVADTVSYFAEFFAPDFAQRLRINFSTHALALSGSSSNAERMSSILGGVELWRDNPFFGAGLGAYIFSQMNSAHPLVVIHSTPVWLLAEFGLFGLVLFVAAGVFLFKWALQNLKSPKHAIAARCAVAALLAFAIFSTVHEILYQRVLWFVLGACLCVRLTPRADDPQPAVVER